MFPLSIYLLGVSYVQPSNLLISNPVNCGHSRCYPLSLLSTPVAMHSRCYAFPLLFTPVAMHSHCYAQNSEFRHFQRSLHPAHSHCQWLKTMYYYWFHFCLMNIPFCYVHQSLPSQQPVVCPAHLACRYPCVVTVCGLKPIPHLYRKSYLRWIGFCRKASQQSSFELNYNWIISADAVVQRFCSLCHDQTSLHSKKLVSTHLDPLWFSMTHGDISEPNKTPITYQDISGPNIIPPRPIKTCQDML